MKEGGKRQLFIPGELAYPRAVASPPRAPAFYRFDWRVEKRWPLGETGFWAVVVARWVPWLRTLAPMLAGAAGIDRRRFLWATLVGAIMWVPVLVLVGYYGAGLLDAWPWLHEVLAVAVVVLFAGGTASLAASPQAGHADAAPPTGASASATEPLEGADSAAPAVLEMLTEYFDVKPEKIEQVSDPAASIYE